MTATLRYKYKYKVWSQNVQRSLSDLHGRRLNRVYLYSQEFTVCRRLKGILEGIASFAFFIAVVVTIGETVAAEYVGNAVTVLALPVAKWALFFNTFALI